MSCLYKSDDAFFSLIIIQIQGLDSTSSVDFMSGSARFFRAVRPQENGQILLKSEYLIKLIGNIHKENFTMKTDRFRLYGSFKV